MRTDEEWLAGLAEGDTTVSAELLAFLRRSLAKGFGRQLSDADLDDLSASSMLRVLESRDRFEGRSRFTTWAASIAVNQALQQLRRRKFEHIDLETASAEGTALLSAPRAPERLQRQALDSALQEAIAEALTRRQQQALGAKLSGMPMAIMAERLGTSRGALYKMLHDVRKRLRDHLEARGIAIDDLGAT